MESRKNVYIAGRYKLLDELKKESFKFEQEGFKITSSWLENLEDGLSFGEIAELDLKDLEDSDIIVLYTEPYGTAHPGGGRHVEFGYAIGRGKELIIVGPAENIFHWLPDVQIFPRTEYAIRYLKGSAKDRAGSPI